MIDIRKRDNLIATGLIAVAAIAILFVVVWSVENPNPPIQSAPDNASETDLSESLKTDGPIGTFIPYEPKPVEPAKPDLELLSHHLESEEYADYIVGDIRNNSRKTYKYVQVEINIYNGSGVQIGSTLANVNNLEPGVIWRFRAMVLVNGDYGKYSLGYKIANIVGF